MRIFKSRVNIVEHLTYQGFNMEEHVGFSINEVDAMHASNQLDMLVSHKESDRKTYVHYSVVKKPTVINIVRDLFCHEEVLRKNDTLIVIQHDMPNDSLLSTLTTLYNREGIFVVVHSLGGLQYNLLSHMLVPHYKVLSEKEKEEVKAKYSIMMDSQFPEIGRFDPAALALCLRPGEVVEIKAKSPTAGEETRYRISV